MLKFLAERKFNYVDVATFITANALFNAQYYGYAVFVFFSGLVLSIYLEHKTKE